MASLSLPTRPHRPLPPSAIDSTHIHLINNRHVGAASAHPFPILSFVSPSLHCKSVVQAKHGIVWRPGRRGEKGRSFEAGVKNCISRAVEFSTHQFRAVLKMFSDSPSSSSRHVLVRSHSGKTTSSVDDGGSGNGEGSEGGNNGGKGNGEGSGGGDESVGDDGANPLGTGMDWCRRKCVHCGEILATAALEAGPTTTSNSCGETLLWAVERLVKYALVRRLTEPVVEIMTALLLFPFQVIFMLGFVCASLEFLSAFAAGIAALDAVFFAVTLSATTIGAMSMLILLLGSFGLSL